MSFKKDYIPWNIGKTAVVNAEENYRNKDWLCKMYWSKELSTRIIAKICGLTKGAIRYWMKKLDIPPRDPADMSTRKKYSMNESIFENCDAPEKAYWIGFIMADGSIKNTKHALTIRLNSRDKKHLEEFGKFLGSDTPIKIHQYINSLCEYEGANILISRKRIVRDLENYGIVPRKTGREQIKNIPEQYYPDFIRGYFDGDGCLCGSMGKKRTLRFFVVCASRLLLEQIQNILIKNCSLSKTKIRKHITAHCYELSYGGNIQVPRIFNYLLQNSDVKLERKYKALMEI